MGGSYTKEGQKSAPPWGKQKDKEKGTTKVTKKNDCSVSTHWRNMDIRQVKVGREGIGLEGFPFIDEKEKKNKKRRKKRGRTNATPREEKKKKKKGEKRILCRRTVLKEHGLKQTRRGREMWQL